MAYNYLPSYLLESHIFKELYDECLKETGKVRYGVEDLINQCYIESATWGLDKWEEFLGIGISRHKPINERRDVIRAKLRGLGVVTKQMIKNIAEAFAGTVDVIEDVADNFFYVKFIGTRGIPANLDDFRYRIEVIKPAHLGFDFIFTYLIWDNLEYIDWNEVEGYTFENLEVTHFN